MLSVDVKINGMMLAHIHAHNLGNVDEIERFIELDDREACMDDTCLYEYEHYEPGSGEVSCGEVTHIRSDGWGVLVRKILSSVED